MPPKAKKQKEILQDERLQAIVLTDSFESRFMPLTAVTPRCLLPLANVPLIEYTLEFLANAGVNEVYLMCCNHADQVQEYIDRSKWSDVGSPFKIATIMSLESRSVGDAMRDVDNRGLITGDFILVTGDVVTNMKFDGALEFHKAKKAQDRNHIATMVLTQASPFHRARSKDDSACFILDTTNNRCLYYQDIPNYYLHDKKTKRKKRGNKAITIDPELLEDVDEFAIRNDLIDCRVDICTPHVPQIFQDNFDYQYLRKDFLKGVLSSDLLKKTIYAYITESDYAARVCNWQTYHAISQDIMARWCFPVCPDLSVVDEDDEMTYESRHIYKGSNVVLAQGCKIDGCTMIGSISSVGDGSRVGKSVIGKNVTIGKNVVIENSYVWDNAVIGDNVQLKYSVVANGAQILSGAVLNRDAVVGYNVTVGRNMTLKPNTRISAQRVKYNSGLSDNEDEEDDSLRDEAYVGEEGVGFAYKSDSESDSDTSSDDEDYSDHQFHIMDLKFDSLELSDDESIISATASKKKSRRQSSTMYETDFDEDDEEEENFEKEAIATVERAMENNHDLDTALLELNTLRMSMNVTYHEVRHATSSALLTRINHFVATQTLAVVPAVKKVLDQWGPLYRRQVFEKDEQVDLLNIFQILCSQEDVEPNGASFFFNIVQRLYDMDICEEENILKWWHQNEKAYEGDVKLVQLSAGVKKFVEWLENAEEESEEESD
ncbi:hypothetical protein BABINDRAFT_162953 [Babjeviella inositovora NRRL Y-12698]|uniref:Translation initiation factor eIF2B subunit epsilon n=1 Tax=Babjeviella inositovora NRRL Y-12698 TaxID=984486 RepID=A0A1E3QKS9_9ASCO|nr:uncharacterized protein BABINDRAFT_162953 [Babjeviella inositovora NRRL Y-12698]ODQ78306.1 hypothetical protein BABINDRAFT_162953 [Babjeviella inositovora NRRL Y-12698]